MREGEYPYAVMLKGGSNAYVDYASPLWKPLA
jgi:hypothetical protein